MEASSSGGVISSSVSKRLPGSSFIGCLSCHLQLIFVFERTRENDMLIPYDDHFDECYY